LGNILHDREVKMVHKVPDVSGGRLWGDELPGGSSIPLDSPQWFAWLEAPTTTSFTYALFNRQQGYIDGFMTVRKEQRQRGTSYWSAYRRAGPRVRKIYLGRSLLLTQAHLEAVATRLHARDGPARTHTASTQTGLALSGDDVPTRAAPAAFYTGIEQDG
jgi:hypothetical protein